MINVEFKGQDHGRCVVDIHNARPVTTYVKRGNAGFVRLGTTLRTKDKNVKGHLLSRRRRIAQTMNQGGFDHTAEPEPTRQNTL